MTSPQRSRMWSGTLLATGAAIACAVMGAVLADRILPRLDLTAGGVARLAPRTQRALDALPGPTTLIIAGELRAADPRSRRALTDVLDELKARARTLSVLTIDTAGQDGIDEYARVLRTLREREAVPIERASTQLSDAARTASGPIAETIARAQAELAALATASTETTPAPSLRAVLEQGPAILSQRARSLQESRGAVTQALEQLVAGVPIPSLEQARAALATPLTATRQDASAIARELGATISSDASQPAQREAARTLQTTLTRVQEQVSVVLASLDSIPRLDVGRVAEALARGSAGILVGPPADANTTPRVLAIDIRSLLPDALLLDAAQASGTDLQRRVEDVLGTSLATLIAPARPLLIITHADAPGAVLASRVFDAAVERLAMRGIDTLEWAACSEQEPEALDIDPTRSRPRVYLVLSPDAASQANATGLTGAQRVDKLATVLRETLAKSPTTTGLFLSLNPSILPTFGSPDPLAALATDVGIEPLSGTPLLSEVLTPDRRSIETDRILQAVPGSHPLQNALRDLPAYFTWTIPMQPALSSGKPLSTVIPLYSVPPASARSTWGESQWQRLRAVRREDRGAIPEGQLPTPDATKDVVAPPAFPSTTGWVVAAAGEREGKRMIVVGSNDWAIDTISQMGRVVDGRPALLHPGNLELLDAGISWLARQDDLIAQSASARAIAVVRPIDERALRHLRLALIAGLPVLVLLTGAGVRLLRR